MAYRDQFTDTNNYIVKFSATENGEEFYFLAKMSIPPLGGLFEISEVQTSGVTEESAVPTEIVPDPNIDRWSGEKESPIGSDSQDILTDAVIFDQLVNMVDFDSESLRAVAYRDAFINGILYMAKYSATENGEEFYFLAKIFNPLFSEPYEVMGV